jgi:hypothetical protein
MLQMLRLDGVLKMHFSSAMKRIWQTRLIDLIALQKIG